MTSSALRERSARPCSPSAQRSASARLLLPDPFGPTTALIPGPNSTFVRSANDLKPCSRRARRRGSAAVVAGLLGHEPAPSGVGARSRGRRAGGRSPGRRRRSRRRAATAPRRRPAARRRPRPRSGTSVSWSGPDRVDQPVRRPFAGPTLGVLLEPALGALERADRRLGGELRVGQRDQPVADRLEAEVEVEGAGDRLERRGEERRPATAAALRLALAEQERRAEVEPAGEAGQAGRRHDRGAAGAQVALVVVGMTGVQRLGDGQVDHGVTEELEAFVVAGRGVTVLVVPAGVDERLLEQVEVADRKAEPSPRGLRRDARSRGSGRRPSGG